VRAVGATIEVPVDVRIVSATHKDLQAEVAAQRFRQDLFYRLNVIQITLPPLRERLEDLPILSQRILDRIASETGLPNAPSLSTDALAALMQHRFPGNVRELENVLHRAVALSAAPVLEPQDLGMSLIDRGLVQSLASATRESAQASELMVDGPPIASAAPLPSDLVTHLDEVERDILVQALEKHRLNRTAAGASLGLSLRQMRYRMARLGVQVTENGLLLGERFDPDSDVD
jgi:two-component system response regulator PilR (NtrC family)